eukprot:scpid111161/ scgid16726/ 
MARLHYTKIYSQVKFAPAKTISLPQVQICNAKYTFKSSRFASAITTSSLQVQTCTERMAPWVTTIAAPLNHRTCMCREQSQQDTGNSTLCTLGGKPELTYVPSPGT